MFRSTEAVEDEDEQEAGDPVPSDSEEDGDENDIKSLMTKTATKASKGGSLEIVDDEEDEDDEEDAPKPSKVSARSPC